jgi:hypothetical protein
MSLLPSLKRIELRVSNDMQTWGLDQKERGLGSIVHSSGYSYENDTGRNWGYAHLFERLEPIASAFRICARYRSPAPGIEAIPKRC